MSSTWQLLSAVYQDVRSLTNKDATTLTDATLLPLANKYYYQIIRELTDANQELYAEISSADLVSGQKEYVLPIDNITGSGQNGIYGGGAIDILRVETKIDGANWHIAQEVDLQNLSIPHLADSSANINANFDQSKPVFAFSDRSIWLFPVPTAAVTGGLMIFWIKRPDELASSSSQPEISKEFLAILSEGILSDVYRKFGRASESAFAFQKFQVLLKEAKKKEYREIKEVTLTPDSTIDDYE